MPGFVVGLRIGCILLVLLSFSTPAQCLAQNQPTHPPAGIEVFFELPQEVHPGDFIPLNLRLQGLSSDPIDVYFLLILPYGDFYSLLESGELGPLNERIPNREDWRPVFDKELPMAVLPVPADLRFKSSLKVLCILSLPDSDPARIENWTAFAGRTIKLGR